MTVMPELAMPLGETAVICVAEVTVNDAALAAANLTAVAPVNPVPVITTGVPPELGPEVGLSEVIAGIAKYV